MMTKTYVYENLCPKCNTEEDKRLYENTDLGTVGFLLIL